ncbi:MAG: hypothetical protein QXE10_06265 [Desulfurococcaceae archaeon]|jgi:uncharacterized membrane protein
MSSSLKSKPAYIVAFIGVGAALYYILLFLPGLPIIGTSASMDIGAALSPIFGLILGPLAGPLAVLLGNTVKTLTPAPSPYGIPFIPAAALSALAAYLLITRKWWISSILLFILIVVSMFLPPFYPVTEQWYVYTIAFYDKIIALLITPFIPKLIRSNSAKTRIIGLYGLFFAAREVDKAFGCFIFAVPAVYEGVFGLSDLNFVRSLYLVSPIYYLVAYIFEALIVTAVAIPVVKAIKRVPGLSGILYVDKVPV